MFPRTTEFAESLHSEAAFAVLSRVRELQAMGRHIIELEIGDSPFDAPAAVRAEAARGVLAGNARYAPSLGVASLRSAAADFVRCEFGIPAAAENIAVGPGAKIFEQFFCETFLASGDGVLVFSPYFATYPPNIARRGARMVTAPLRQETDFRPPVDAVARFLNEDPQPRAIFLNFPHNPTGGLALLEDLEAIADLVRGTNVAIFSDEPYCHMNWQGDHASIAALPDMLPHTVTAFTFSKSYSMSGYRLGFCVGDEATIERIGLMLNSSVSCCPPFLQEAAVVALRHCGSERDKYMGHFQRKVGLLTAGLQQIPGVRVLEPQGTFYVFPDVSELCRRLDLTDLGLAAYLLEGADQQQGVACLGGSTFGDAGRDHLRFSCAADDEDLQRAVEFITDRVTRSELVVQWKRDHPEYCRSSHPSGSGQ